jgi:hypothetical protein
MILTKNELQAKARKYWLDYFAEEIEQLNQLMLEAAIRGETLVEFNALDDEWDYQLYNLYIEKGYGVHKGPLDGKMVIRWD